MHVRALGLVAALLASPAMGWSCLFTCFDQPVREAVVDHACHATTAADTPRLDSFADCGGDRAYVSPFVNAPGSAPRSIADAPATPFGLTTPAIRHTTPIAAVDPDPPDPTRFVQLRI
jgi:hypothetical protein